MEIINVAAYKFVGIQDPSKWREAIRGKCVEQGLKGTILLAPEGINLFVAGERDCVDNFLTFMRCNEDFGGRFTDLVVKESVSDKQPFRRMNVRLKKEIITMKHPMISPEEFRAPAVDPRTLKTWLDQGHDDEGRLVVMLDTRNEYEIKIGTFEGAISLNIDTFGEFPQSWQHATTGDDSQRFQNKTIVSFCTGGIRCEKAALYMRETNFANVVQLDGGILRYFEEVGGAHWNGACFVFDKRGAVDTELKECGRGEHSDPWWQ
ncbi:MAG: sulfurtransferase [Candidatus Obscuribacterales bacterium]|nr:sulfurtransferase [Candidatus Obscuribacterales bacterium]